MGTTLAWIGAAITYVYFAVIFWIVHPKLGTLFTLPLNAVGDFLAGVFGPLAILWLILGFFQQRIELKQNTEALNLQATELKNSVEQQAELANVAKQQLEYEREKERERLKPKFIVGFRGATHSGGSTYRFSIRNTGNGASDVHIKFDEAMQSIKPCTIKYVTPNSENTISAEFLVKPPPVESHLQLSYHDAGGNEGNVRFHLEALIANGVVNSFIIKEIEPSPDTDKYF